LRQTLGGRYGGRLTHRSYTTPGDTTVGRWVVEGVMADATEAGLPVRLSVLDGNPARRLYERLGFRAVGRDGNETVFELEPSEGGGSASRPALRGA
ncbi:MAG: GNAT family N-acetyltransferase, partial [Alphaproteobacteria bacterium]|nr:GNAT family N-acetyltransferase [Alphaproteobacteria bacterium]